MRGTREFLVDFACPVFGVVVSNLMYGSPLLAALKVRRTGEIGVRRPHCPVSAALAIPATAAACMSAWLTPIPRGR